MVTTAPTDLIYDWNEVGRRGRLIPKGVTFFDETLRDGLQNPSVTDPPVEKKLEILHLMNDLGIHAADMVNTVSPTFLHEMVTGQFDDITPGGVAHAMRQKHAAGRTMGILNAPGDSDDPRLNPHVHPYDIGDVLEGKRINKEAFQKEMGLLPDPDAPLFLWPSRLYAQKGPELLSAIAASMVAQHGVQLALVANGDRAVEATFRKLAVASELLDDLPHLLAAQGFEPLPVSLLHGLHAGRYPMAHRDPFDRLLAAQAERGGLGLVSVDPALQIFPCRLLW